MTRERKETAEHQLGEPCGCGGRPGVSRGASGVTYYAQCKRCHYAAIGMSWREAIENWNEQQKERAAIVAAVEG